MIRLTTKTDGEPYCISLFLTIIRYKILMLSFFNSSLSGCQNYRAFGTVICRFFNTLYLQRTASLY